ncbi:mannose-6-phosphate isomerase [Dokdonia pacifica]|uniref:Cupin domain-containing protein n=1 Tax=Dokdonia pacifica TaxID=1627892 RepID=A0A238WP11_9FLAO|nr:cupin domain-containing protein [Dokdonia pacifica]GGG22276.1 mannose-6-phosphate isomerase [Dokdonia pacifica]SNR47419.1 Cupin domain-containing protein [Dokdonia pacifica]
MKPINIKEKYTKFDTQWHPHQIALVDDMQVILAKISGEFVWHSHKNEDELFYVQRGTLYMRFRESGNLENEWSETVHEGEIIVVPKGVEHCPTTKDGEEVHLLLFEKQNTAHTGDVQHEKTQTEYPKI